MDSPRRLQYKSLHWKNEQNGADSKSGVSSRFPLNIGPDHVACPVFLLIWSLGIFSVSLQNIFILNQMRRFILFSVVLAGILSACTDSISDNAVATSKGEVIIALSSLEPQTRSEEVNVPDVADFVVEIYSASGIRLYRDSYANSTGKSILLNSGEYRLLAQHGDSAGVGFNSVWFAADSCFTVRPQTAETIKAVARMSKVKAAVKYGAQIALDYNEFYVELTSENAEPLRFAKDETRAGYTHPGTITPLVYAMVDGELRYFKAGSVECAPGDFVTFNVDTKPLQGSLSVKVTIDNGVELVEKDLTISSSMLPKDGPSITVKGFEQGNVQSFMEAVDSPLLTSGLKADVLVPGLLESCLLEFAPESASQLQLPESVDLCAVDEGTAALLSDLGFDWVTVKGKRLALVDFTDVAANIVENACDPGKVRNISFKLTVKDALSQTATTDQFTISEEIPQIEFSAHDWNAYAKKIDHLEASVSKGNPQALKLQYQDGGVWKNVEVDSRSGKAYTFKPVKGLNESTEYRLRAIYNDNPKIAVENKLTTEAALQLGNSSLENWRTNDFVVSLWFGKYTQRWYDTNDGWWAVNSRVTMPSSTSASDAINMKCYPTVQYVSDCTDGSSAAQLVNLTVCSTHTYNTLGSVGAVYAPGELFLGSANADGSHASDGHSFASRPQYFTFDYKYESYNDDHFYVMLQFLDAGGVVLAEFLNEAGLPSESWSSVRIPLEYQNIRKKAASVKLSFKSSSKSSLGRSDVQIRKKIQTPTGETEVHAGSVLKVDNIKFIYE